jgi:hypothetical protein
VVLLGGAPEAVGLGSDASRWDPAAEGLGADAEGRGLVQVLLGWAPVAVELSVGVEGRGSSSSGAQR